MRNFLKKIFNLMPKFIRFFIVRIYSEYYIFKIKVFLKKEYPEYLIKNRAKTNIKPRILFYHISGLSFGGTEKFLQILAKHLNYNKYDIYFMYSSKPRYGFGNKSLDGRLDYLKDTPINFIPFDYEKLENKYPYFVYGMSPSIFEVIQKYNIDLLITAGSGYSEFPFNVIKDIPIILLNIFGSPNAQKNIVYNVCISKAVARKTSAVIPKERLKIMYIQSEEPTADSVRLGRELRQKLGILDDEIIFGRIGRADDNIFDPIGIRAFQKTIKEFPRIHYLIMSPPPILEKIVENDGIANVHFLPPSADENDIWAFHQAIDVLSHFRKDGESCGLNIVESMLCGKPIISHKSRIWNAHLEYLDDSFSRVADVDNTTQYADYLKFFAQDKDKTMIKKMGELARQKAELLFLIKNNINYFEIWLNEALKNTK